MIFGIGGKLSSGKTVTAVRYAYDEGKKGKKVISNIKLFFPKKIEVIYLNNTDTIEFIKNNAENPETLYKLFSHSVILWDEITNLFNARKSGSLLNDLLTSFIMYCGKMDADIVFTYQVRGSQVDKRLREICNIYANCYRVTEDGKPLIFSPRIVNKKIYIIVAMLINLDLLGQRIVKQIYDPEPIYKLYDTREIILLDRSKYLKKGKKSLYS